MEVVQVVVVVVCGATSIAGDGKARRNIFPITTLLHLSGKR